ncbi:hypothetical protein LCGC14_0476100 [marine sediment metagenome]|uniref:HTH cro/C1-type domain-containing protein n=1 Tax=marine sediment metagenome TaxID=412755 RepID=A0A0F9VJK5_9ZZZZ
MTRFRQRSLTGGHGARLLELDDPAEVTRRRRQAAYERCRANLSEALSMLMKDLDITESDIGERMGETKKTVRQMIKSDDLQLSKLTQLADVMSHDIYIILRPREPWTKK